MDEESTVAVVAQQQPKPSIENGLVGDEVPAAFTIGTSDEDEDTVREPPAKLNGEWSKERIPETKHVAFQMTNVDHNEMR